MKNFIIGLFTFALVTSQSWALPVMTYNTGVDSGTSPSATGSVVSSWLFDSAVEGDGLGNPTSTTLSGFTDSAANQLRVDRHSAWTAGGTQAESAWLVPYNTSSSANGLTGLNYAFGEAFFTYSTTFDLSGYDVSSATITGIFSADNDAVAYLNGTFLGSTSTYTDWSTWTNTTVGFTSGVNTITVVVRNLGASTANPTGFRVEYGVDANLVSAVPEIDTASAGLPVALVLICLLVVRDRRQQMNLA